MSLFTGTSPVPLDDTLGAVVIGIVVSAIIYGITCLQVYLYFTRYASEDKPLMKLVIFTVWILDGFHVALIAISLYHYTVTYFGNLLSLLVTTWSLEINILVGTLVTFIVQSFYAWRVRQLTTSMGIVHIVVPSIIVILSLAQVGFGLAFMAGGFELKTIFLNEQSKAWAATGLGVNFLNDSIITVSVVSLLRLRRSGLKGTNKVLTTLVTYTISTGMLTAVTNVACLVSMLLRPRTFIYAPFFFVLCRLYAVSMLSMLNSRETVRSKFSKIASDQSGGINLGSIDLRAYGGNQSLSQGRQLSKIREDDMDRDVYVEREVYVRGDGADRV